MKCKHEYRLLDKWLIWAEEKLIDDDREVHKFYCIKCLNIKIKEVKKDE